MLTFRRAASLLCLPVLVCILGAGSARAEKGTTEGTYRDREGKAHPWSIERSHLLVWDGAPYAPAGVVFHSRYLAGPSEAALQKDTSELDRLKSAGVQDVWVEPGRGLLQNSPTQIQALVDALEARGFRYGLRVGDRHREPLIGFTPTIAPIVVPAAKLQSGAVLSFEVPAPGARRVAYVLSEMGQDARAQNWAIVSGEALVERNVARLGIQLPKSRLLGKSKGLLTLVPEVQVDPDDLGSFGDLWAGTEAYSERLRKHAKALKFGAGLRFLLDPFAAGDGTVGQEDLVFPTSPAFQRAFTTWLQKRGILSVNINWRLTDRRLAPGQPEEAARLIPTWSRNDPPEGDGWLIDPVERVAYRCIPRQCSIWDDLDAFRAESLKRWMNLLTTSLKRDGLDVPMLFTWSSYHPIFTNNPSPSGYDGLAGQLYGSAATIAREQGAYALAQAEEADRNTWLIASRLAGPVDQNDVPAPLADASQARQLWEAVRSVGFRGVFIDPAQAPAAESIAKELASSLGSDGELRKRVPVIFFPMPFATSDRVTRLSNGVWWLPSASGARMLRYGDDLMGYDIDRPFGADHSLQRGTVLWSPKGKHEVTFAVDKLTKVEFFDSAGGPLKVKLGKKEMKISVSEEPIVATGLDTTMLFPLELAASEVKEFGELLAQAEAQKLDVTALKTVYTQAKENLSSGSAAAVYRVVTPQVARLREVLMPYIWVEGERSISHNLSGVAFQAGASLGTYLKLDRPEKPLSGVYRARYSIDLRRDATYEIWVAGKVPGRPGVSPLIWQLDEEPAVELPKPEAEGADYAPGMGWYMLGRMTLKAGRHELTLVVPERSDGDKGRYSAAFDAIVFAREAFKPNGTEKPSGKPALRAGNTR